MIVSLISVLCFQGPSEAVLSGLPTPLRLWFETFTKPLPTEFHPGLLDMLLHLEMMKYNADFAFSPRRIANVSSLSLPNGSQSNPQMYRTLIRCLEFLLQKLMDLKTHSTDDYRSFSKSNTSFKSNFASVQGADVLLKYSGWSFIETDAADNGGVYVYGEENDSRYLNAIIELLTVYTTKYLVGKMESNHSVDNVNPKDMNQIVDGMDDMDIDMDLDDGLDHHDLEEKWDLDHHSNTNHGGNSNENQHGNQKGNDSNDMLSIFEESKEDDSQPSAPNHSNHSNQAVQRQSSYLTVQEEQIKSLIAQSNDQNASGSDTQTIVVPTHLNVDEYLLRQRAIVWGARKVEKLNVYEHQWPSDIPGYAMMEEHRKKGVVIYTYSWDEVRYISFSIQFIV